MRLHNPTVKGAFQGGITLQPLTTDIEEASRKEGLIWFNKAASVLRYVVDNAGTLEVQDLPTQAGVNTQITIVDNALKSRLNVIEGDDATEGSTAKALKDAKDYTDSILNSFTSSDFDNLEALVNTINGDSSTDGSFRKEIAQIIGAAPEALNTLQEIAAALENDAAIAETLRTLVVTSIDNAKEELKGSVSAAFDTLEEVEAALNTINGDAATTGSIAKAQSDAQTHADNLVIALKAGSTSTLADLDTAIQGNDTDILALQDWKNNVAAGQIQEESINQSNAVRTEFNNTRFAHTTSTPNTTHNIAHNLGTQNVLCTVWVQRADGLYYNDLVGWKVVDNNTIQVAGLSEAANVKVSVMSMEATSLVTVGE